MITDITTGVELFSDINEVAVTHIDADAAYTAWAADLGVSSTATLSGLTNADDGSAEIDLGFVYTLGGVETKLMQSTEGSIGFYTKTGGFVNTSRPISKVLPEQVNVSRAYTTRSLNPSMIINCKIPSVDSKSYDTKWQKTGDTAILFIKWSAYGNSLSNRVDVALKISQGSLDIVCSASTDTGVMLQIFMMNSTNTSGQAIAGNGNFGKTLLSSTTYQFSTAIPKRISGNVTDSTDSPSAQIVRAYDRDTGKLLDQTLSDAITGFYELSIVGAPTCYVVCLDDSASMLNALIIDRIIPVD
jgi:hypothetical protein